MSDDDNDGEGEAFNEDKLSHEQLLLLYGYKPTALLPWGAIKCKEEKAESAE